jgi:alkaline phosphatase D
MLWLRKCLLPGTVRAEGETEMEIIRGSKPPLGLFDRRGFLTGVGATLLGTTLAPYALPRSAAAQNLGDYPFTLGVASGDPMPDGVVLWTRLATQPLEEGGGMPQQPVPVQWVIASDEHMRRVVRQGAVLAVPELGHSVHVEVSGLKPARWYWYQFKFGTEYSPIGRTRTAPRIGSLDPTSFAFVSCQHYANGFYYAHKHMAEEDLYFGVHLGDYIYEGPSTSTIGRPHLPNHEITTIEDYRIRYALYKSDPHLQAVHAAFPWIMTWDDHETENDYAGFTPENPADPADNQPDFASRRARAYQAYYEHMPLRSEQFPVGPDLQLYRRLRLGSLITVFVLDTRQYRSHRAPAGCDLSERVDGYCPEGLDPTRTIQGRAQDRWLINGLGRSAASWNLLANQVPFAPNDTNADAGIVTFGGEKWDGYPAGRQKVLDAIAARGLGNTIVITGDVHQNFVRNVPPDYLRLDAEPIATEFIGTSVSTGGDRTLSTVFGGNVNNPHLRFSDNHHGYVRCTATPDLWQTDYRVVPSVIQVDDGGISTVASFVVEKGRAGAL